MGAPVGNPGIETDQKVCDETTPDLGPSERTQWGTRALRPGQGGVQHNKKKGGGVLKRKVKGGHPKKEKERGHRGRDGPSPGGERVASGRLSFIGGSHRPKKKKKKKKIHTEDVPVWQHTGSTWRGQRFEEGRTTRSSHHRVEKG